MKPADCRVLVVGKTGSGKSTLCNRLLRRDVFPVYSGMAGQTTKIQLEEIRNGSTTFQVVDTPDIFDTGQSADDFVRKLRQLQPAEIPTVVLLVVRLDTRFTPNDSKLYDDYLWHVARQYRSHVAIVFTRVEGLDPVSEQITLSSVQELVKKTQNRWVAAYYSMDEQQRQEIFHTVLESLHDIPKLRISDKITNIWHDYKRIILGVGGFALAWVLWWYGWLPMSLGMEGQHMVQH